MAFQVTPETDVAEAAMFHGAYVSIDGEGDHALSSGNTLVPYGNVEFDTDGFWNSGSNRFEIPEGVVAVQVGCNAAGFGATTQGINVFIRVSNGTRGNVRLAEGVSESANIAKVALSLHTGPIYVETGERLEVFARYLGGGVSLVDSNNYPNNFWIKAIKTPFGRPDSPTLP